MKTALIVVAFGVLLLSNCGGGSSAPAASSQSSQSAQVSVSLLPGTQQIVDAGEQVNFTASVANDSGSQGVSWSISGNDCSGSGCGTLTNTSKTSATYNAPANLSAALAVAVKATSAAQNTASASVTVTANPSPVITTTTLPGGKVTSVYSATLQSTGGTAPLSWSVMPGTSLPAGLTLDPSTGVISGTPTSAGSKTFTVKVIDSAPTPQSATQQLSINIGYQLIITTTLLQTGSVNVPYDATPLQESYGTQPVSWSISAGSLPPGLSLASSTGVISGTPTTAGISNFTVEATDSTTPTPETATKALSITIQPGLSVSTTSLPDGTVGVAYTATLEEHYGTIPLVWSIVSNSGTLPGGLTLNSSSGVISGTPNAAGTYNFTVMVTDSSSPPQTATQSLSITIQASGLNDTELSGRYAFLLSGYDSGGNSVAAAGSFVANGAGVITGGVEDINGAGSGLQTGLTITSGDYAVNSDNRGTITFTNSNGKMYTMGIAMGSLSGGSTGTAEKGSAVEFDSSGYDMSGVIVLQSSTGFYNGELKGNYAFSFQGSDRAGKRLGVVGEFDANGSVGITGGQFDADDDGIPTAAATMGSTGTYAIDTSTGRVSATLNGLSPAPADYVFYLVSANKLLALSTDAVTMQGLVSGEIDLQSGAPFSNGSLDATEVMEVDSAAAAGGSQVTVGLVSFDGNLNVTSFSFDTNNAATLASEAGTGIYTAPDSVTGRFSVTFSQGMPPLVGYLIGLNHAFVLGTGNGVTAGKLQAQTGGSFSNTSLDTTSKPPMVFGSQAFATTPEAPLAGGTQATLSAGIFTFDGSGNLTTTRDSNRQGTLLPDQPSTDTYTVSSNGRVTLGSQSMILYIVSQGNIVTMSTNTGDTDPTLGFIQQ